MSPAKIARTIRSLILQAAKRGLKGEEQQHLEETLDLLLDQPVDMEEDLVAQLLDDVSDVDDAADIFLTELEIQSSLVFLGDKQDQAAMLIAIPVMFMAGDTPNRLARSTDDMVEIAHVLTESDVIGAQTRLALLPRLFRPEEMVTQSYGTLRALTTMMGEQVLVGDPVRLMPGILAENVVASDKFPWGDNPYLDLRFIIGVVVTHESMIEYVFPLIGSESTEGEIYQLKKAVALDEQEDAEAAGMAAATTADLSEAEEEHPGMFGFDETPPGLVGDGEFWEGVFLQTVDDVFSPMFGAQSAFLPDDFHEALRSGLELWRRTGVRHQINAGFADGELVIINARAYRDEVTSRTGWDLFLSGEDGTLRDQAPWEALLHEHPDDVEDSLRSLCETYGWKLADIQPLYPDN